MNARLYSQLPYAVEIVPDLTTEGEQVFVARHPELPGCMSHGETPEAAISSLADARELYIESLIEDGIEPPVPASVQSGTQARITWTMAPVAGVADLVTRPQDPTRIISIGQLRANQAVTVGAPDYAAALP